MPPAANSKLLMVSGGAEVVTLTQLLVVVQFEIGPKQNPAKMAG
jgi:hypothetical protein